MIVCILIDYLLSLLRENSICTVSHTKCHHVAWWTIPVTVGTIPRPL